MEKSSKIYIAGHLGMVGSALKRNLEKKGYTNIIGRSIEQLDLSDQHAVNDFFAVEKPEYVLLAAAKVGGIVANNTYRAQFIYENLQIQNNIIHHAYKHGVKKLLFLGSSCIYPKESIQPITEESLLTGPLEYTNEPYAIAKIAGIKLCENYNLQYNTDFISVMPTNLYGPNDNYDLEKSHVLPALIRKMHLGKCLMADNWEAIRSDFNLKPVQGIYGTASEQELWQIMEKFGIRKNSASVEVILWGTGSPYREFLHADDMADACIFIMENISFRDLVRLRNEHSGNKVFGEIRNTHINIGNGTDLRIRELAEKVKTITGFRGDLIWDSSKPDGTPRKLLNVDMLHRLGWKEKISLDEGIGQVYKNYLGNK